MPSQIVLWGLNSGISRNVSGAAYTNARIGAFMGYIPHPIYPTFFVVSLANNFRSGIVSSATLTSSNGHQRVKAAFLLKMLSGEATSPTSHPRISNRGLYSSYPFSCSLFVCESYYLFPIGTGDIFQRGCPERSFWPSTKDSQTRSQRLIL